jgi:hypothetical protein
MAPYLEINVWSHQVQVQEPPKMNLERYLRLRQAVPVLLGKNCILQLLHNMSMPFPFNLLFMSWLLGRTEETFCAWPFLSSINIVALLSVNFLFPALNLRENVERYYKTYIKL